MIDKLGKCPNCGSSWLGQDVLKSISELSVFHNKSQRELVGIAKLMGYDPNNPNKFSKATVIDRAGVIFIQCHICTLTYKVEEEVT